MKNTIKFISILAIIVVIFTGCKPRTTIQQEVQEEFTPNQTIMKLTSSAFENKSDIPSKYTCDGDDINPPITISDLPENTVSLALIADDPDAPAGTWIHWLVWNIDPSTTEISENSVPNDAVQGTTSFGDTKYGGPCPPSGTHRYYFKLYALDTKLDLDSNAQKVELEDAMEGHILDQTELMGTYSRS